MGGGGGSQGYENEDDFVPFGVEGISLHAISRLELGHFREMKPANGFSFLKSQVVPVQASDLVHNLYLAVSEAYLMMAQAEARGEKTRTVILGVNEDGTLRASFAAKPLSTFDRTVRFLLTNPALQEKMLVADDDRMRVDGCDLLIKYLESLPNFNLPQETVSPDAISM